MKDVTFIDSVNHLENRHQKGSFGPCQMPVTSHDLDDFGCPFGQASSLENLALWGWFKKQTATTNALTSLLDLIEHTSIHMLYSYINNYVYVYIYVYIMSISDDTTVSLAKHTHACCFKEEPNMA